MSSTEQTYQAIAELYAQDFGADREHFDLFIDLLIRELSSEKPSLPVIDLGSGPGNVIDYLLEKGVRNHLIAIDFAKNFIAKLKKKYTNIPVEIIDQDMVAYVNNLPAESVRAYVANYSIIHIPDEEISHFFENIKRTLTPNGSFIFSVWGGTQKGFEPEPYQVQNDQRLQTTETLSSYMNYFTKEELLERLTQAGFNNVSIEEFKSEPVPGEFNSPKIWVSCVI